VQHVGPCALAAALGTLALIVVPLLHIRQSPDSASSSDCHQGVTRHDMPQSSYALLSSHLRSTPGMLLLGLRLSFRPASTAELARLAGAVVNVCACHHTPCLVIISVSFEPQCAPASWTCAACRGGCRCTCRPSRAAPLRPPPRRRSSQSRILHGRRAPWSLRRCLSCSAL